MADRNGYNPSIMGGMKCYLCGTIFNLVRHEVFFGPDRQKSKAEGCWCYLCATHHNLSNYSPHMNREVDLKLKRDCQKKWMEKNGKTEEEFRREFGKSYLYNTDEVAEP